MTGVAESSCSALRPPQLGKGNVAADSGDRRLAAVAEERRLATENRARGRIDLQIERRRGRSTAIRIREDGSLRVRFPRPSGDVLEAVTLNTAGGVAGGDRFDFAVELAPNTQAVVTSTAAEKVYRSAHDDAELSVTLRVAENARLSWLPQETILFDRARLRRRVEIDLAPSAELLFAEAVVFGRTAMGEAVEEGALRDQWRIRRDGQLLFAEAVRLFGPIARKLSRPAMGGGARAFATILVIPGLDQQVAAVRLSAENANGAVGASCWNGVTVVRFAAADGAALRRDLFPVLQILQNGPLPRLWLN